jgi:uncharacterized membrane protein YfcA
VLAAGSYILPVKETIALATVLFAASTVTKTLLFGKHIDWRVAGTMALGCLPFAYLGASLLAEVPADLLKRLLGIMVLAYLALTTFKLLPKFTIGMPGLIAGSAAYGFVSGLLGSGNLIKVIIFREMNITKEAFVGAMAATSVLSNMAKLSAYSQTGILTADMAWPMAGLIVSAVLSALIGRHFLRKVSVGQFGYGVQIVLGVCAVGLLV